MRRFRGSLLMALAVRHTPSPLAGLLEDAIRASQGARLDLGPLSKAEAQALMDPDLDAPTRDALYHESGGNPFYLHELLRSITGNPATERDATWQQIDITPLHPEYP